MDISAYKTLEPLSAFAERKNIAPNNARRDWLLGKRTYLEPGERAVKIGRDWVVLRP